MSDIKANDLRIGNLVKYYNCNVQIQEISEEYLNIKYESIAGKEMSYYNEIEPIPLTEEWLLKFGFKSDATSFYLSNGIIELEWVTDEIGMVI